MQAAAFTPIRRTALHEVHELLGVVWSEEDGWRIPRSYTAPEAEAAGVREGIGLLDASALGKLALRGRDAAAILGGSGNGRLNGLARRLRLEGEAPVAALALPLAPDEWLLLTAPGDAGRLAARLADRLAGACAHLTDLTSAFAALRVAGPRAPELLPRLLPLDLSPEAFPNLAIAQGPLAKVRAIVIREDPGPHPGYLLLVARDVAEYVWGAVLEAGRELGLGPVGTAALPLLGPE